MPLSGNIALADNLNVSTASFYPGTCAMQYFFNRSSVLAFKSAFPNHHYTPSVLYQLPNRFQIICYIDVQFGLPELPAAPRPFKQVAFMFMPEASIDKNNRPVAWKNKVRVSRQASVM
jgi:hypothetical protein